MSLSSQNEPYENERAAKRHPAIMTHRHTHRVAS